MTRISVIAIVEAVVVVGIFAMRSVRLPPQFYSPDWRQVDGIEMRYLDRESRSGVLQLRLHNTNGSAYVETVGRVQRSCWNAVKSYISGHIENKNTVIHMLETTAK